MAARPLVWHHTAPEFDAIGSLDHHRKRRTDRRIAFAIPQEGRQVHGLARTVDTTLGVNERVRPGRHGPSRHTAIAEIKCVGFETEECVVALVATDREQRRRQTAFALRQTRVEQYVTRAIGFLGCENFVIARDQPDFRAIAWCRRRQRVDEDVDAVIARISRKTQIRDNEPLRCQRP